ncbi:phage capsid protein [Marinovum algicola]|uniref:phage capsid protein n=1 Tax=Marinovum algicola TaxID=42444 RepID=UPI003B52658D
MSYRQTVSQTHRETYRDNIRMVAQQMQNPLRAAVVLEPASGEAVSLADLMGKKEYQEGADYSRTNVDNPTKWTRRWLTRPTGIVDGEYITKEEKFDKAMDPTSRLVSNSVKAVERGVFDRLLGVKKVGGQFVISGGGIMGGSQEGRTPGALTPLPAGNFIAVDYDGGAANGLTTGKLRGATEAMELEDFGLETEDEIYSLITPKQKTNLINLALATGNNLNPFDVKNISEGKPGKLLGINWLFSNRVPVDENGYRLCPVWSRENIGGGVWQDVDGDMWNDSHARNLPYINTDAYIEAGRIEDGGVRVIRCAE